MLKNLLFIFRIFLVYSLLCVACFLMLRIIIGYTSFSDDVQFLLFKKDYIHNKIWKTAFYIHVFSAVAALFAGFTQFSKDFLQYNKKWHRLIGKIYVWNILVINFPAGMILAIYANGQLPGKIAFILLDILWFYFTYKGLIYARRRNFVAHKYNMMRSYALTFSAITLRGWKVILSYFFVIEPNQLYIIEAWMGFVPNLIIIELIILAQKRQWREVTASKV